MSRQKKLTAKQVIEAIPGTGGIKTGIAQKLGVHRNTVDRYIKQFPTIQKAYDQEVGTVGDIAETTILKAIKDGDIETAKWYARVKLKDRGYSEKYDIESSGKIEVDLIGSWEDLINGKDT